MARQFTRDSILLVSASGVQNACALGLQLILARALMPHDFGRLSLFMSATMLISLFASGGIVQYLPALTRKRLADHRALPFDGVVLAGVLATVVAVVNGVVYYSGLYRYCPVDLGVWFLWISLFIIGQSISQSLLNIAVGAEKRLWYGVAFIIIETTRVAGVVILWTQHRLVADTAVVWWTIHSLAVAGLLLLATWIVRRRIPLTIHAKPVATMLQEYAPAFAYFLPVSSSYYLPRLLIFVSGAVAGATSAAYLSVAMTFISIYTIIFQPLQTAFLAEAATSIDAGRKKVPVMMAALAGIGVVIIAAGHFLTVPLFGVSYADARGLMVILALIFLAEWPKAVIDVLWLHYGKQYFLTVFELLKIGLIVFVFGSVFDWSLSVRLIAVGVVFAGITLVKATVLMVSMARNHHE